MAVFVVITSEHTQRARKQLTALALVAATGAYAQGHHAGAWMALDVHDLGRHTEDRYSESH